MAPGAVTRQFLWHEFCPANPGLGQRMETGFGDNPTAEVGVSR
jgi:hypothetical protein